MSPEEDLDPPTFAFGEQRRTPEPDAEPPRAAEAGGLPDPDELLGPEDEDQPESQRPRRRLPDPSDLLDMDTPDPAPVIPEAPAGAAPTVMAANRTPSFLRGETAQRILWAIPWAAVAITAIAAGGLAFTALMVALAILALRELFTMTEAARPLEIPAYAAAAAMSLAALFGEPFHILLTFAAVFPAMFIFAAARDDRDQITVSMAITVLGVAWLGGAFAHAVLLRELPDHGGALLIDVLVATFIGDTAAYGGGRLFGSRKISPRISPNKTLEGLFSGFLGATMGFWFAGLYQDWLPGIDALLMGMAIGLVAPIGDLFASMVKRDLGIKDTGRLFGPHGGAIDRLDAVSFTVVVGYYLAVAFVY